MSRMHWLLSGSALCAVIAGVVVPVDAVAGRVEVAEATASSSFPPEEGASYDPKKVLDGKIATSWVEGEDGSGLGSWVELKLAAEANVQAVHVWPGMWYSREFWERANRPSELEISVGGTKKSCEIPDEMKVVVCEIGGVKASSIKLKVKATNSGTTWLDTAISEVQVFDATEDGKAPISTTDQSSMLEADADGSYDARNVTDGILDTMWCEGNKEGDGKGEWIRLFFDKPREVSNVTLVNGIGGSIKYWMLGNRATKATLTFEDDSTQKIEIKNSARPQTISFEPKTTRSVKIAFDEVYKGKEYNDLCISEAYFGK